MKTQRIETILYGYNIKRFIAFAVRKKNLLIFALKDKSKKNVGIIN